MEKEIKKKHVTQQTSILTAEDIAEIKNSGNKEKKEKKGLFSFFKRKKKDNK